MKSGRIHQLLLHSPFDAPFDVTSMSAVHSAPTAAAKGKKRGWLCPPRGEGGKKNGGGRQPWTTEEQRIWLDAQLHDCSQLGRGRTLRQDFYSNALEDWIRQWPPPPEQSSEEKQVWEADKSKVWHHVSSFPKHPTANVKKIRDWLCNHKPAVASEVDRVADSNDVLDFRSGAPKRRSLFQIYSKLYYKKKLRNIVNEAFASQWSAENPGKDKIPRVPPGFRNRIVKREFENESEEVKDHVRREQAERHRQDLDQVGDFDLSGLEDLSEMELNQQREARSLQR